MPNVRPGMIWQTGRGTTIATQLLVCDATNTPVEGDFVKRAADGEYEYLEDNAVVGTKVYGICVSAVQDGKMFAPGYTAATLGKPAVAHFGGRGSRASTFSPANQRFLARLYEGDRVVLTPSTDAGAVGTAYGLDRVGAGDYRVDIADAVNTQVRIEGHYSPDVFDDLVGTITVKDVWVSSMNLLA